MKKIIRTITKKCSCGYVFTERQTKTTSEIIDGNQKFIEVSFLNGIDMVSKDFKRSNFIICPKCGTLLCKKIATAITEEKS